MARDGWLRRPVGSGGAELFGVLEERGEAELGGGNIKEPSVGNRLNRASSVGLEIQPETAGWPGGKAVRRRSVSR